jgi:hypothetical protein
MYSQVITRRHRSAFVIAIDQSSSMSGNVMLGCRSMSKAKAVAIITNSLLDEIILRSTHSDGLRDYYDVALIGYADQRVYSLTEDEPCFVPVTSLATRNPERVEFEVEHLLSSGEKRIVTESVPGWIRPHASGSTPMYEMLSVVNTLVDEWCHRPENADSFPPIVFHITDGEPTDCEYQTLRHEAARLRRISTSDGEVLFVNIHISSEPEESLVFPRMDEIVGVNQYARLLADMSSIMPSPFNRAIEELRNDHARPPFVAMSYNANIVDAFGMLNIGSYSATNIQ